MRPNTIKVSNFRQFEILNDHTDTQEVFPLFPAGLMIDRTVVDRIEQVPELVTRLSTINNDWARSVWYQALEFLKGHKGSVQTLNKYRTEIERFLLWCLTVKQVSPYALKPMDVAEYIEFMAAPLQSWIGLSIQPHFVNGAMNPKWRPFVAKNKKGRTIKDEKLLLREYKPSKRSFLLTAASLSSFYSHCEDEGLCDRNPVKKARNLTMHLSKDETATRFEGKRFGDQQWEILLNASKRLAKKEPEHERTLFLVATMKVLHLRISELSSRAYYNPTFADFKDDGEFQWLYVIGKGKKGRLVPIPDAYEPYLKRYRKWRGLPPLLQDEDEEPIISAIQRGCSQKKPVSTGMSSRQLSRLVQAAFDEAVIYCSDHGFNENKQVFERATTHMLRHTGASMAVEAGVPLKHVSENLGHGSSEFTDRIYVKSDEKARAESNKIQGV